MRAKDVSDAIIIQSSALVFSELINEAVTYNSNGAVLTGAIKHYSLIKENIYIVFYDIIH